MIKDSNINLYQLQDSNQIKNNELGSDCKQPTEPYQEIKNDVLRHSKNNQGQQFGAHTCFDSELDGEQNTKKQSQRVADDEGTRLSMSVRKKSAKFNALNLQCPLCLQSTFAEELSNFTLCSHKFCIKCSLQFVKEELEHFNRIQCPTKGCGAFLDCQNVLLTYLSVEELEKVYAMEKFEFSKRANISQHQIQLSINQQSPREENIGNPKITTSKDQQQIVIQMQGSKRQNYKSSQKSAQMFSSSQECVGSSGIQKKKLELKKSRFHERNISRSTKQSEDSPTFPKKAFSFLCEEVWLNKWSRFLKMLPISLVVIFLAITVLIAWTLWVIMYFVLMWVVFVPMAWAVCEIWGCFKRSFKSVWLRKVLFTLCLFGFPLIFSFFYLLTLGIVLIDALFKADMRRVIEGKASLIICCQKVHLYRTRSMAQGCGCRISENCSYCENKNSIFCLVL